MTEHPKVFQDADLANKYAKSVLQSLGIDLVVKPRRIVQVITPNKIHASLGDAVYLVLPPQGMDLDKLQTMCGAARDKVREKLEALQAQQTKLLEDNSWLDGAEEDEGNNLS